MGRIEHVGLWVKDLEMMRHFYEMYFGGTASKRYDNAKTNFSSYFLTFDGRTRLELMTHPSITSHAQDRQFGWAHVAFTVADETAVRSLTTQLAHVGQQVIDDPRWTGDGYYESKVLDPEGNLIEITADSQQA